MLRDERALDPLTGALGDVCGPVREAAAAALGELGDNRAIPALLAALPSATVGREGDVLHRRTGHMAALALAKLQARVAADPLVEAMLVERTGEIYQPVLASLGDAAVPALEAALREGAWNVFSLARVLVAVAGRRARPALVEALERERAQSANGNPDLGTPGGQTWKTRSRR